MIRSRAHRNVFAAILVFLLLLSMACAAAQNLLVTPTPVGAKTLRLKLLNASQDATVWLRYYEQNAQTATVQSQKPDEDGVVSFVIPATNGGLGDSFNFQFALSEAALDKVNTFRIPREVSLTSLEYDFARDELKIVEGRLTATVIIPIRP